MCSVTRLIRQNPDPPECRRAVEQGNVVTVAPRPPPIDGLLHSGERVVTVVVPAEDAALTNLRLPEPQVAGHFLAGVTRIQEDGMTRTILDPSGRLLAWTDEHRDNVFESTSQDVSMKDSGEAPAQAGGQIDSGSVVRAHGSGAGVHGEDMEVLVGRAGERAQEAGGAADK